MSILLLVFSLVLGLYFQRINIVISIIIAVSYLIYLFWRFGKKIFFLSLITLMTGIKIPNISFQSPKDQTDYGGLVIHASDNYIIFESKLTKYYVYSEDNDFEVGDYLVINGNKENLKITTYESRFDFKKYLNNKGVEQQIKVSSIDRKFKNPLRVRGVKEKILSKYDENAATLISAFLFNDKDYKAEPIQYANEIGIVYLFALSGVYLHALFAVTNYFLFLKFDRKKSQLLTFLIFLPFAIFSFSKIGTLRVYSLYLLKYMNEFHFKKKKFNHTELVSILALIFIIVDYHLVYQEAFYIGFLLSIFSPVLLRACKSFKRPNLVFPILISILLLPLRVKNGNVSVPYLIYSYSLSFYNTVFIVFTLFSLIIPFTKLVNWLAAGEVWILEKMDLISIRIPFSTWGGAFSIIFIGVFLLMVFYLESIRKKHATFAVFGLIMLITISIAPFQEPITNAVYFVNVGQGDSIIIKNKNHTVMIDTGGNKSFDMANESLIPFMNSKKITHLDALILTHDDFDHSGAKDSLTSSFKVSSVITSPSQFPLQIGDLYIENLNTFGFDNDNDSSLVLSTTFMKKKFLFMGDASTNVEEKILNTYNVDCDILKIGHHGSKTSTSEKFLKACSPKEAIISVGATNYYGHPNTEVIQRLEKYNVKIRRTDLEGTISYLSLLA